MTGIFTGSMVKYYKNCQKLIKQKCKKVENLMNFSDYAAKIKTLGREINTDTLKAIQEIIAPLINSDFLEGVNITRDIQYAEHERHRLGVFTAKNQNEARPVLLFVHGGDFVGGDKHSEAYV